MPKLQTVEGWESNLGNSNVCSSCTLLYAFPIEGSILMETATKGQFTCIHMLLPCEDMTFVPSWFS